MQTREEANAGASLRNTPLAAPLTALSAPDAKPTRMPGICAALYGDGRLPAGQNPGAFCWLVQASAQTRPAPASAARMSRQAAPRLSRPNDTDLTTAKTGVPMRSCLLTLTPAGLALLAAAVPLWERAHAQAEGGWSRWTPTGCGVLCVPFPASPRFSRERAMLPQAVSALRKLTLSGGVHFSDGS